MRFALVFVAVGAAAVGFVACSGDDKSDASYDSAAATTKAWSATQTQAARRAQPVVTGATTRTATPTNTPTATATATNTPTEPAKATATYERIIGKQFSSPEVLAFVGANKCQEGFASASSYLCTSAGMELKFDGSNRLSLIIFKRAAGDWKQYAGPLPGGLAWSDTRAAVDQKLGSPVSVQPGAFGSSGSVTYQGGAIVVTYDSKDGVPPPTARIGDVRLLWK